MLVGGESTLTRQGLIDALDELLSEPRESVLRRERTAFDEAVHPLGGSLVLFGAGGLGRKSLQGLRRAGIEPVAFSDNDPRLWGTSVQGVPVLAPADAAARFGKSAAFVLTIWRGEGSDRMPERIAQVRALGCERVVPFALLFWKYPELFLPHYAMDLPHRLCDQAAAIRAAAALWEDSSSRLEFLAQVRWRLQADFAGLPHPARHEIYFPEDLFSLAPDEVFVDCGAFDGDTIRRYLARQPGFVGHINAFEPDPANFAHLQAYVAGLPAPLRTRIDVFPHAVSSSRQQVRFDATGTESASVGSGSIEVEAVALDDVLGDRPPTYIKMDTEGSEPDGVAGARTLLRRHAPVLALCVYHRQDHLWAVPNLVRAENDDYRFFLRPHLLECWDTVMYAIPVRRLHA
jgi:FkbM family methyltransferase